MISILLLAIMSSPVKVEIGVPVEIKSELKSEITEEIKDKKWYRWTTDNFVILSIDYAQGDYLFKNVDNLKKNALENWGFPDVKFNTECRLICVRDSKLFETFFKLKKSKVEVRKDLVVVFLLLNDSPSETLPEYITQASLAEFSQKYNIDMPLWMSRGISLLNRPVEKIRQDLRNKVNITAEELFNNKVENKDFDIASEFLCLMLRKEFGEVKLNNFLKIIGGGNEIEESLFKVYRLNMKEFNSNFQRYVQDLSNGINKSETPDSYLEIK